MHSSPLSGLRKRCATSLLALSAVVMFAGIAKADDLTLPASNGGGNGNARGYYFVAPVSFTITSATVLDATGTQYVEILGLSAVPPQFSDATTDYTVLDYSSAAGGTSIAENIHVNAGQVIGVLGWDSGCGCTAYGDGDFVSSIYGNPVTLSRFLTQQHLDTAAGPVSAEDGGSIGRTLLTYGPAVSTTPEPSSLALLGTGALGVIGTMRKRFKR